MAHRIVAVVIAGGRVFGRALTEAWKQANAAQRVSAGGGGSTLNSTGITLDEACKILNVAPPKGGQADMEQVMERFKKLFDINDPQKGGSFYLQSKVLRARERVEAEARNAEAKREEAERQKGWKPKVYKDK